MGQLLQIGVALMFGELENDMIILIGIVCAVGSQIFDHHYIGAPSDRNQTTHHVSMNEDRIGFGRRLILSWSIASRNIDTACNW